MPFRRVSQVVPPVIKLHMHKNRYVVFGVIAFIILLAAAVTIGSTIGSPVGSAKNNPTEIVESTHKINVGYLQNLAANGLSSIRASGGMLDESVNDIKYDVETDGTCFIEITGTAQNGNVAYFVEGKPNSPEPVTIGKYNGQVVVTVTDASIAHGSLSISPIVKLSQSSTISR